MISSKEKSKVLEQTKLSLRNERIATETKISETSVDSLEAGSFTFISIHDNNILLLFVLFW